MLRDYKIETMASFIFGDIKETKNMMLETIKYAKNLTPAAPSLPYSHHIRGQGYIMKSKTG